MVNILLLEDDFALNKAIKNILLNNYYNVDSFYDGLEAYNNLSTLYDLYLLI